MLYLFLMRFLLHNFEHQLCSTYSWNFVQKTYFWECKVKYLSDYVYGFATNESYKDGTGN
jgi:hypothetical protein